MNHVYHKIQPLGVNWYCFYLILVVSVCINNQRLLHVLVETDQNHKELEMTGNVRMHMILKIILNLSRNIIVEDILQ